MVLTKIRERAAADLQHIILPEGEDVRTVEAAAICAQQRIAKITIIGNVDKVRELAGTANANLNGVDILDHRSSDDFGKLATLYHQMRRSKGVTLEEAEQTVKDPL
ncbi:MAG: phosphate acyltransferase, partial [Pyrinomonadaceae bacterium]